LVITGAGDEKTAVEMMKQGAEDYLVKEPEFYKRLPSVIYRILEKINITDRLKESERRLRRTEERMRLLLESAALAVFIIDDTGILTFINTRTEEYFGYPHDEMVGHDFFYLVPEPHREKHRENWKEYLAKGLEGNLPTSAEVRARRKNGEIFPLELSLSFYRDEISSYVLCMARDVTEERKTRQELANHRHNLEHIVSERTAELVAANRSLEEEIQLRKHIERKLIEARDAANAANSAKSEFLANMSHELRTPLNSILGFGRIMQRGYKPERYERNLDNIVRSANHLLDLINDILDLSKIESGKVEYETSELDPTDVIEEAFQTVAIQAREKGLEMKSYLKHDNKILIKGDRTRLKQVCMILLTNAVNYTNPPGSVSLVTENDSERLRVLVKDTGIGIDPSQQELIFENFYRVESSSYRTDETGTGLGLSIARKIALGHGGSISVESAPGEGSVFTFEIPLSSGEYGEEDSITTSDEEYPDVDRETAILVVDDEPDNLEVMTTYFELYGQNCLISTTGADGLEKARYDNIGLVLMDIRMEDMDGIQAMKAIREKRDVPVVALTAYAMEGDGERFLDEGFSDYIPKPIDFERLNQVISRWLPARRNV
jgi:PAS domain S-box-containing protein